LAKNDQDTGKQQYKDHWRQPPPLVLPKELKKLTHDAHPTGQTFYGSHLRSIPLLIPDGFLDDPILRPNGLQI
jgi:hypothetical protein